MEFHSKAFSFLRKDRALKLSNGAIDSNNRSYLRGEMHHFAQSANALWQVYRILTKGIQEVLHLFPLAAWEKGKLGFEYNINSITGAHKH